MPISPSTENLLPRRLRESSLHHIALVGMPGVGKSTVARLLGAALSLPVLDLDEEIASAARKSIAQLFVERGEVLFRAQERAVLRELLHRSTPSVIACGGGTWADATMRRDLMLKSVPLCLTAPVEVLLERLSDPAARKLRPLLGGPDPVAALRKLERERRAAYVQCPTQLDTEGQSPEQVAQAALALLEEPAPPEPTWAEPPPKAPSAPMMRDDVETVIERNSAPLLSGAATTSQAKEPPAAAPAAPQATAPHQEVAHQDVAGESTAQLNKADDGQGALPGAPQIPWWPTHATELEGDSDVETETETETELFADADSEPMDVDGLAAASSDEPPEPAATHGASSEPEIEAAAAEAAPTAAPAPLAEENTPTLAAVARSLAPFAAEKEAFSARSDSQEPSPDAGEESWQPQISAWAPLEEGRDGAMDAEDVVPSSSAAATHGLAPIAAQSEATAEPTENSEPTRPLVVSAEGRAYPVHIAEEAGDGLPLVIAEQAQHHRLAIICDTQINALFIEPLRAQLTELGLTVSVHTFVAGEEAKTLKTVYNLYDELSDAKLGRGDLIVGFGGGVTLDVAGFVASTYLRGVRLMMVPTSTLAAVDACVGGKNGVNTRRGKNLVGTIYPPHAVYIAMDYLATQSRRAHTAGLVEVLKMGALLDPELFAEVASGALLKLAEPEARRAMRSVLRRALSLKAQVVEEDEHERGRRAILNYGHTVGHALEIEMGNGLSHGEAVGLGMVAEAGWAEAQGLGDGVEAQLKQALEAMNMPVDWRRAKLSMDALAQDKKRRGANVQLPVLRALGDVTLQEIPLETLADYTQPPAPEA